MDLGENVHGPTANHLRAEPPLVVQAPEGASPRELAALLRDEHDRLRELLLRDGALLFRGFDVTEPAELSRVIAAAGDTTVPYLAGISPRHQLGDEVYTSTELPARLSVPLHSELCYLASTPRRLWFACVIAPSSGGETRLADARAIFRDMARDIRQRFVERGIRYQASFHGRGALFALIDKFQNVNKSWMDAFDTDDRSAVERACREIGAVPRWLRSGRLVIETVRPAVRLHPETDEPLWFNSAHLFRHNPRALGWRRYLLSRLFFARASSRMQDAHYADGGTIDLETLERIQDVLDAHTVSLPWQRGDVLWIDNFLCMHGRAPYRGPRRLLAALTR
jgi:alpha-ketoglutarate-dependent taurine dioxygenase